MIGAIPIDRDNVDLLALMWCMNQRVAATVIQQLQKSESYLRPQRIGAYALPKDWTGDSIVYLACGLTIPRGTVPMTTFLDKARQLAQDMAKKMSGYMTGCFPTGMSTFTVLNQTRVVYIRPLEKFDTDFFLKIAKHYR